MAKYVKKESPLKGLTKKEPRTINMRSRPKLADKSNKSVAGRKAGPKKMGKAETLNKATKAIGADKAKIKARGIGGPAAVGTLAVAGATSLFQAASDENLYPKGVTKTEKKQLPKQKKQPARSQPKGTSGNMAGKVVSKQQGNMLKSQWKGESETRKSMDTPKQTAPQPKKKPDNPTRLKSSGPSWSFGGDGNPRKFKSSNKNKSKLPKSAQFIQDADW